MGTGFQLGTFRRIPIYLHWSLAIIFLLLTWSIASGFSPEAFPELGAGAQWVIGAVTAALFIGSVLAHELGHAVVAQRMGVGVKRITLLVFGGVAELERDTDNARAELRIAVAGPIVSFVLAAVFLVLAFVAAAADATVVQAPLTYLGIVNGLLAVFNLIPGFPLDGGRILRAIVWQRTGSKQQADLRAAQSGQLVGFGFFGVAIFMILTGNFLSGVWLLAIGWFIQNAAGMTGAQASVNTLLQGVRTHQAMEPHVQMIQARTMLRQVVDERILGSGERFFVVTDGSAPLGVLSLSDIIKLPRERWDWVTVAQAMVPWSRTVMVHPDTAMTDALQIMAEHNVSQVPVVDSYGRPVGVLSREMVFANMRLRSQLRVGMNATAQERQRAMGEVPPAR